jgi:hypothetical protein
MKGLPMEKIDPVLPKGIKTMSLVNVEKLNLNEEATNRVVLKISEAVFAEYARIEKPSSLHLAGRISDLIRIHKEWVGIIPIDKQMQEILANSLGPQIEKQLAL